MNVSFFIHLQTLWQLLKRNYFVFLTNAKDRIINTLIWAILTTAVMNFIMPQAGLNNLGAFMLVTTAGSIGFFGVISSVAILVGDITGDNAISYELTLPIPHWMVFTKIAFANAFEAFIQALVVVPVGKLLFWNSIPLPHFSITKFIFMLMLISLFSGFFSLFLASIMKTMNHLENLWHTLLFPMWFLGSFQFSWKALHTSMPWLSYISLLNPLTYVCEGIRSATLQPDLYLPYTYCCYALIGFIGLFGYIGITVLKRRLDCI